MNLYYNSSHVKMTALSTALRRPGTEVKYDEHVTTSHNPKCKRAGGKIKVRIENIWCSDSLSSLAPATGNNRVVPLLRGE